MREFICDYALISPAILVDRVCEAMLTAFAYFADLDEDRFIICVDSPFVNESASAEDLAIAEELITPYLWKE